MSRLHRYSPGLSPNMFADVLTAMDMTFFFCWTKVFPWAGSWTLFLMTAGCSEEHCWAGWKLIPPQWNYHLCEQLLFFWHDLQQEAWGCERNMKSGFQQSQNGGVTIWKAEGQMTQLQASFCCQYFKCHEYNYDLKFPVLYIQMGTKNCNRVGFWKLMDLVESSPKLQSSTKARLCILISNCQLIYVLSLRCLSFQFVTELCIACCIIWFSFWIEGDDNLNGHDILVEFYCLYE